MSHDEATTICKAAFEEAKKHFTTREAQCQRVALMAGKDHRLMEALVVLVVDGE